MPAVTQQHVLVGVTHEPLRRTITIAEGEVYVIGPGGHYDPGVVFEDVAIRTQTEDVFVSSSLRGVVGDTDEAEQVPPLVAPTPERWPVDTLFLCNRQGSGGSAKVSIRAGLVPINNSGQGKPCHPGNGTWAFVVPEVPDGVATVERTVQFARTVAGVSLYAKTPRTSAAGDYRVYVERVRGSEVRSLLSAAYVDAESLSGTTINKPALAVASILDLRPGDKVRVRADSDNADLTSGDLLVAVDVT